jgi:hypothetical protein
VGAGQAVELDKQKFAELEAGLIGERTKAALAVRSALRATGWRTKRGAAPLPSAIVSLLLPLAFTVSPSPLPRVPLEPFRCKEWRCTPTAARVLPAPRFCVPDYKPICASIGGHLSFQGAAAS